MSFAEASPTEVSAAEAQTLRFGRADWQLDFHHHDGASGRYYMVETNGGGVVIFDYDGDGDDDVFFADGGMLPGYSGQPPKSRLFRNDTGAEGTTFRDVTDAAGLHVEGYGSGGAAGDVDRDGDLDLYVTAFGANRLFRNDGGRFTEIGGRAGVADELWGASAAFADVDRDGDLDLYVVNYVSFTLDNNVACGDQSRGLRGYCGPDIYDGQPDRLFRNDGGSGGEVSFTDVTTKAGLAEADGAGLALSFGDLDGDGWIDLYVANDKTPNFFFRNLGDGTFEDLSLLSGTALGHRGFPEAGMGVAIADLDGDALLDVVVTNYEGETNALYRKRGSSVFSDQRFVSGLGEPTLRKLAFGVVAGDLDHDGDLDLAAANGHVRENAAEFNRSSVYKQPNQLFENASVSVAGARFREVVDTGFDHLGASRGLAQGDLDLDGDLDLVFTNVADEAEVYENLLDPEAGSWVQIDLRRSKGNRFGVGARLELEAAGRQQIREVTAGSSYMSQSSLTAHFGLGKAETVERLTVRWPRGGIQVLRDLPVDRRYVVVEP